MGTGRILDTELTLRRNRSPKFDLITIGRAACSAAKE
jgi:hypothetical protein